jgi:hypothetical protein
MAMAVVDVTLQIASGVQLALALIFLASGGSKLWHFSAFRQAALNYHLGHAPIVGVLAGAVPFAELLVGACWISPFLLPATAGSLMLLLCFTVALSLVLRRGRRVMCGCFGIFDETPIGWNSLARNAVLATLALVPWLLSKLAGSSLSPAQGFAVPNSLYSVVLTLSAFAFLLISVSLLDGVFTLVAMRAKIYPLPARAGRGRKASP